MKVVAICHTCRHRHIIDFNPHIGPGAAFGDWLTKHPGSIHRTDFLWPERSGKAKQIEQGWPNYLHNADVKVAYGSSASYTITLASLATSSTLLDGRESDYVSNTTNLYLDYLVSGYITSGTTPTANTRVELFSYGSINDSFEYPDSLDGADSAESMSNDYTKSSGLKCLTVIMIVVTTNMVYSIAPVSLAALYSGSIPKRHGLFLTHNTGVNLYSSGQLMCRTPVYATVI